MLRLASDADVHGSVVLRLHELTQPTQPSARVASMEEALQAAEEAYRNQDFVSIDAIFPEGTVDSVILQWAASERRILLTNDRNTMIGRARQRVRDGLPMPGLIAMPPHHLIGKAIEDVLLIAQ